MNIKYYIIFLFLIMFNSCTLSDEQLLNEIEQTERIEIKRTFYGGIGGSGGIDYTLKRSGYFEEENDWVLIRDEGTQFQTYILLDSSQIKTFRLFVREAIKSHDSNREYYRTCDSSSPSQYDIRIGSYSRHLQPDNETDSIFYSLIKEFCLGKHIFE